MAAPFVLYFTGRLEDAVDLLERDEDEEDDGAVLHTRRSASLGVCLLATSSISDGEWLFGWRNLVELRRPLIIAEASFSAAEVSSRGVDEG